MIGIKVQNLLWEKTLLDLLKDQAEKYQEKHVYNVIISETKDNRYPTLILGKDISLPFSFDSLKEKLGQIQTPVFENKVFKWIPQTHQLIHKKSQKIIQLTEKESEIIAFLAQCPNHKAKKEEILQSVWHYQNDIHTHTLESHIYALRQKLMPYTDRFIDGKNGIYRLI